MIFLMLHLGFFQTAGLAHDFGAKILILFLIVFSRNWLRIDVWIWHR